MRRQATGWCPAAGTAQGTYLRRCRLLSAPHSPLHGLTSHLAFRTPSRCWRAISIAQQVLCRRRAIGVARCPAQRVPSALLCRPMTRANILDVARPNLGLRRVFRPWPRRHRAAGEPLAPPSACYAASALPASYCALVARTALRCCCRKRLASCGNSHSAVGRPRRPTVAPAQSYVRALQGTPPRAPSSSPVTVGVPCGFPVHVLVPRSAQRILCRQRTIGVTSRDGGARDIALLLIWQCAIRAASVTAAFPSRTAKMSQKFAQK